MSTWEEVLRDWAEIGADGVDGVAVTQSVASLGRPVALDVAVDPTSATDEPVRVEVTYLLRAMDFEFILRTHAGRG